MKHFIFGIFTLLMTSACGGGPKVDSLGADAEVARKAIGITGAQDVWRCVGKISSVEKQYLAVALQQEKDGTKALMASRVQVDGKNYSQTYLFLNNVKVNHLGSTGKEEYIVDGKSVGNYNYNSQEVQLTNDKVSTIPVTIDCANATIK